MGREVKIEAGSVRHGSLGCGCGGESSTATKLAVAHDVGSVDV